MYIRGENTQGNIAKFMAIKENTLSLNEFYRSILHEQEEDPDNFYCSFVEIASEPRIFVATEHPLRKSRGTMTTNEILARCVYLLKNPLLGSAITEHIVYIDDDGNLTNSDGYSTTAVVNDKTNMVFVSQAGFRYVRLVTIWSCKRSPFMAKPYTRVIELKPNGFVKSNNLNISNVIFLKDDIKRKDLRPKKYDTRVMRF